MNVYVINVEIAFHAILLCPNWKSHFPVVVTTTKIHCRHPLKPLDILSNEREKNRKKNYLNYVSCLKVALKVQEHVRCLLSFSHNDAECTVLLLLFVFYFVYFTPVALPFLWLFLFILSLYLGTMLFFSSVTWNALIDFIFATVTSNNCYRW